MGKQHETALTEPVLTKVGSKDLRSRSSHDLVSFVPFANAYAARLAKPLRANPGEPGFINSYVISNWFPIIAASLGPVANMNSIVALVDNWRLPTDDDRYPPETKWVLAVNAVSLFFGCLANASLLMNYTKRLRYNLSQTVSIGGWYCACGLLLALFIATKFIYFHDGIYSRSQGFWHGVITSVLYFISATMLLINEIGHLRGQYKAAFNLTTRQRSSMVQNVVLIAWIALGGVLFKYLINVAYADAIYYCTVTILTVGLGDVVPKTVLSRALILPYAFIGIILLGLIVATIRQIILEAGGQTVRFHRSEKLRQMHLAASTVEDEQESFEMMRRVWEQSQRRTSVISAIASIFIFVTFLLLGALVFYFSEDHWDYFQAVYFAFMCLLTVGYGDISPISAPGRAFFVAWSLAAVPLMTILISNLGDTLFSALLEGGDRLGNWVLRSNKSPPVEPTPTFPPPRNSMQEYAKRHNFEDGGSKVVELCHELRCTVDTLITKPDHSYRFDEWQKLAQMSLSVKHQSPGPLYWLSEQSPIRYPITEPYYFLEKYFMALENELSALLNQSQTQFAIGKPCSGETFANVEPWKS